jgi:hypothetical protein
MHQAAVWPHQVAATASYTRVVAMDLKKTLESAHPLKRMQARRQRRRPR